jgi:hypothetical protein
LEVGCVADSMGVVAGLPDFAFELFSYCVGVSAFDALNASLKGLILGWSYQDMNVLRHDCEAMERVTGLFSIMKEGLDK